MLYTECLVKIITTHDSSDFLKQFWYIKMIIIVKIKTYMRLF